jgi:Arc/MetJ family transcription regulator
MSRTNIELDDDLVARAMHQFGIATKREVVDLALRRLVGTRLSKEFLRSLEGIGWDGDLEEMRHSEVDAR